MPCNGTNNECVHNATMKIKYELQPLELFARAWKHRLYQRCDPAGTCGWISATHPHMDTIEMVNQNPGMGFEYYLTRANNHDMQVR